MNSMHDLFLLVVFGHVGFFRLGKQRLPTRCISIEGDEIILINYRGTVGFEF